MRSREEEEFGVAAHAVIVRGEPIPLDVAALLMEQGVIVDDYETDLEKYQSEQTEQK